MLRATAAAYNAAADDKQRAECGLAQLRAIVDFLQSGNDEVADCFLLRPAHTVLNALYDRVRGGKPALLQQATGGWASDTTRDDAAALLAFCVELLRAGNFRVSAAAEWVATKAQGCGITSEDGKPITTGQILTWYHEIKKQRAPAARIERFKEAQQQHMHAILLEHPDELDGHQVAELPRLAQALAMSLVKTVAHMLPRSAPRKRR